MIIENNEFWATYFHNNYLKYEPFYSTSIQQVIVKSKCFNDLKIYVKQSIQILNELVYVLNQGQQINQLEKDLLYFRVTKLLQINCIPMKIMAYSTLKLILNQNNKSILIQIVLNEIQSQNSILKLNALRMISHLYDLVNQNIIERIIRNSIISQNQLQSSAAMLVGLKILQNHPTVILRLTHELYERLNDKYQLNSFHAVLLLHESKKHNQIKLLNQIMKLNLSPIAKMQLQPTNENQLNPNALNQENIDYLLYSVNSLEPLLILEAIKSIVQIGYFSEDAFKLIINSISPFLESHACQVNKYAGLSIVKKIISNKRDLLSTLCQQFINLIEDLSFHKNKIISRMAVELIYIIYQENSSQQLAKIYNVNINEYFLEGIHEAIVINPIMVNQIVEFINLIFERIDTESIDLLLNILEYILENFPQYRGAAIDFLIRIGYVGDKFIKFAVIQVLSRQLIGIDYEEMEYSQILNQLKFFENQYLLNNQNLYIVQNMKEQQQKISQIQQVQFQQIKQQNSELTKNTDVETEYSIIQS